MTFLVKAKLEMGGTLKNIDDLFIWLTADKRHLIVQLKFKTKIGFILGRAKHIEVISY